VADGFNGAWPLAVIDSDGNGRVELAAGADVLSGSGPSHGPAVYDLCSFRDGGSLTGSVLDTGENPCWAAFDWQAASPAGTSVSAWWRSSDDPGDLGTWSGPFSSPSELSGLVHRYVQFRIDMSGGGSALSPVVEELSLVWDPSGIEPGTGQDDLVKLLVANPCPAGFADMEICTGAGSGGALVSIYDIAGRMVWSVTAGEGRVNVRAAGLVPGCYMVRAESGPVSGTVRLVML
jgi:hypothetical protein